MRGREESAGVKQRRKEAQKRVGPKLTGQTLLTHRREPLSYFLVLYILYIYVLSMEENFCSGCTDFGAPTVVCYRDGYVLMLSSS